MEAATPLPFTQVRLVGDTVRVDGLTIRDECAVRLISEADEPARVVADAIEIGARVLDREQTGAGAEAIKVELAETSKRFTEHAARLAERMDEKVMEVFGAEDGELARLMARHFGDESNVAVQHRIKALMTELQGQMREDLRKQLTGDSEDNPIVAIQRASLKVVRDNATAQNERLEVMAEKMEALKLELAGLRAEKDKLEEIAAVEEKGTAKGRTYEEEVADAIDALAHPQGDVADAVGDLKESTGKKGDVVVSIDACNGPSRGRIVFEAKNARMTRPKALEELDLAMAERNADYGVLVVPSEEKVPAKMHALREYNGDKLIVAFDPEEGPLALQVAYSLARARILMSRGGEDGVDLSAVRDTIERALGAMEDVRRIKQQLTGATTQIKTASEIVTAMSDRVKAHLADINELLAAGADEEPAGALFE
jgi:hypothetical protein